MEMEYTNAQMAKHINEALCIQLKADSLYQTSSVKKVMLEVLSSLGINLENLMQIPANAPDHILQYPEAYQDAIINLNITKGANYIINLITNGENKFTLIDLLDPNPRKMKNIYIIILDLFSRLFCFCPLFDAAMKTVEEELNGLQVERENLEQLKNQFQQIKNEKEQMKEHRDEANELLDKRSVEYNQLKKEIEELKSRHNNVKEEIADITTKTKDLELKEIEIKKNCESVQANIFAEEEMAYNAQVNEERNNLKEELAQQKRISENLTKAYELKCQIKKEILIGLVMPAKGFAEKMNESKKLQTTIDERNKEFADLTSKVEQLTSNVQHAQQSIVNLSTISASSLSLLEKQKHEIIEQIKLCEMKIEATKTAHQQDQQVNSSIENEISEMEAKIQDVKRRTNNFDEKIKNEYNSLSDKLKTSKERINGALRNLADTVETARASSRLHQLKEIYKLRKVFKKN